VRYTVEGRRTAPETDKLLDLTSATNLQQFFCIFTRDSYMLYMSVCLSHTAAIRRKPGSRNFHYATFFYYARVSLSIAVIAVIKSIIMGSDDDVL